MITSCNDEEKLVVQIGDVYIDIIADLGGLELAVGIFASLEAGVGITVSEDPDAGTKEVGFEIGEVTRTEVEIVAITPGLESFKDWLLEMIEDEMLDGLLDGIGGKSFGAFPIPEIDVSSLDPSIPPGTMLKIKLQEVWRNGGFTALKGYVE